MPSFAQSLWNDAAVPLEGEMFGVSIAYQRGADGITVTAIPSVVDYELFDADGLTTIATIREYLIVALDLQDLATAGTVFDPRKTDRITETINGTACTFEVVPVGNKPAAELQLGGARWLVRTKQVS